MLARAVMENGRVKSVAIRMVPSFVFQTGAILDMSELGTIRVDTVCVGGFFAMISTDQIGLPIIPENKNRLIRLGMDIIEEANRQLTVRHPERPEVMTVDVTEFYDPLGHAEGFGKSAVIYGESHMDRSPCGTGTAAKLSLLHHKGLIKAGQVFRNTGPLNTVFDARIVAESQIGGFPSVEVEIQGSAHITGMHTFFTDDSDPLSQGFLL
jgi:proline racemase